MVLSAGEVGAKAEKGGTVAFAVVGVASGELLEDGVGTLKVSINDEDSSPGSSSNEGGTSEPSRDCVLSVKHGATVVPSVFGDGDGESAFLSSACGARIECSVGSGDVTEASHVFACCT
jgi:hypothetical protein